MLDEPIPEVCRLWPEFPHDINVGCQIGGQCSLDPSVHVSRTEMRFQQYVAKGKPALAYGPDAVVIAAEADLGPFAQQDMERSLVRLRRSRQIRSAYVTRPVAPVASSVELPDFYCTTAMREFSRPL
jgi:hypothetical protein